jgi:hypothetical protein
VPACWIAPRGHPAPQDVFVERFGRFAGREAALIAVADPVAAAVRGVDLVGEDYRARRVEAEFVFGIDEDEAALASNLAAARE